MGRPENSERLQSWARANPPDGTRQTAVALEEAEDVPSYGVFRVLMTHAGFPLPMQDRFQAFLVVRVRPQKVTRRLVIHVGETAASGMNLDSMGRTVASANAPAHWESLKSSLTEFGDSQWHLSFEHAPNYTASYGE